MLVKKGWQWEVEIQDVGHFSGRDDIEGEEGMSLQVFSLEVTQQLQPVSLRATERQNFPQEVKYMLTDDEDGDFPILPTSEIHASMLCVGDYPTICVPSGYEGMPDGFYFSWSVSVQGYLEMHRQAKQRGNIVPFDSFSVTIQNDWLEARLVSLAAANVDVDLITAEHGLIYVEAINTASIKFVRKGGTGDKDLYVYQDHSPHRVREYIARVTDLFRFDHPARTLLFEEGVKRQSLLWRENGGRWQRGQA